MLLRRVKQTENENLQIFAERLLSLAKQAQGVIETHLCGIFVDGLYSDRLRLKVMRDNPNTMTAAINSARLEFTLKQRFQLRTGRDYFAPQSFRGEPMEIDHYRPKHQKVSAVEVRYNKEIVCRNCRNKGHISAQCPRKQIAAIEAQKNETVQDLN